MLRKIIISQNKKIRYFTTKVNTVDNKEIERFQAFSQEWWNEFGPVKALHSMNKLRLPLIRDSLINSNVEKIDKINTPQPLEGLSILDIGCGGGILSEPLARLGGNVTGIDANNVIINIAKAHADCKNLKINYVPSSIEEHSSNNVEQYDAIIASEILEHVTEKNEFIAACTKCLKPLGSIFITTMSKTTLANIFGIIIAEKLVKLLPEGTHEFEKFIEPHKLIKILRDNNCRTDLVHGMFYNVLTNNWRWCTDTSINYALHAVKLKPSK